MTKDEAKLIYYAKTVNGNGISVNGTETAIDVDVEVLSVGRTEAYLAMQSDKAPTIIFRMRTMDFDLSKHVVDLAPKYAEKVRYDGFDYNIIRIYSANGFTELTCG